MTKSTSTTLWVIGGAAVLYYLWKQKNCPTTTPAVAPSSYGVQPCGTPCSIAANPQMCLVQEGINLFTGQGS